MRWSVVLAWAVSANACGLCPEFTFYDGQDCAPCGPGTFSPSGDRRFCRPCPPGRFSAAGGATECSLCAASLRPTFVVSADGTVAAASIDAPDDVRALKASEAVRGYVNMIRHSVCGGPAVWGAGTVRSVNTTSVDGHAIAVALDVEFREGLGFIAVVWNPNGVDVHSPWKVLGIEPEPCG